MKLLVDLVDWSLGEMLYCFSIYENYTPGSAMTVDRPERQQSIWMADYDYLTPSRPG